MATGPLETKKGGESRTMAVSAIGRLRQPEVAAALKRVDDFLVYLSVEKGASTNTVAAYRNDLQQLVDYLKDGLSQGLIWEGVERAALQDFILDLKQRGYTQTSVARKVAAVRSFFAFLASEGV